MTSENLSIVFAPNVFRSNKQALNEFVNTPKALSAMLTLLKFRDFIFTVKKKILMLIS